MKDQELDFGTDPAADAASDAVSKEMPCAGGCGLSGDAKVSKWRGFMSLDDGKGGTCTSPVWHCDPCFKAKHEREWAESQARLPEHVQALRARSRDLLEEAFGSGQRRRQAEMDAIEAALLVELKTVNLQLQAEYALLGFNPDPVAVGADEPQVH